MVSTYPICLVLNSFRMGSESARNLPTRVFFNEYRLCIGHIGFAFQNQPPNWKDKYDWINNRSTKWDCIVKLIHCCLRIDSDDVNDYPINMDDVDRLWKERPDRNAKGKVVLYAEFVRPLQHLINVSPSYILAYTEANCNFDRA